MFHMAYGVKLFTENIYLATKKENDIIFGDAKS